MKLRLLLAICICLQSIASAQATEWAKTYGGSYRDWANSIQQTSDGGYVVAGVTYSFGAGGADFWVLKLDSKGDIEWQKTYGGSDGDWAWSIQQTSDGGYVVAGAGWADFWVLKLDSKGDIEWQKTYGGSDWDEAWSIQQTSDGGYVVAGSTCSFGAGEEDFWVLKLDSEGNITNCPHIQDSNAQVSDTSASVSDTDAQAKITSVQEQDTAVTPQESDAEVSQICYYSPPAPIPEFGLTGFAIAAGIAVLLILRKI